jgi:hypothetical protein
LHLEVSFNIGTQDYQNLHLFNISIQGKFNARIFYFDIFWFTSIILIV